MKLRFLASAGLLLAATPHLFADGAPGTNGTFLDYQEWLLEQGLTPRPPVRKLAHLIQPLDVQARLYVKFVDWARMRPAGGGMPVSESGMSTDEVAEVLADHGARLVSMFEQDISVLNSITDRAAALSHKAQPDLGGMMYVQGPESEIEDVANALNALDIVEFVRFERPRVLHDLGLTFNLAREATASAASGASMLVTPNFRTLQEWQDFYGDLNGDRFWDPFPPASEPFIGGLDVNGLWDTGWFLIDEGLTDADWNNNRNGARGATINVGVIEFSLYPNHEDLRVTVEPGQTLLPPRLVGIGSVNHGTAVTGMIGAKDQGLPGPDRFNPGDDLELGVIGVVPEAKMWFFPIATAGGGDRFPSAMAAMLNIFGQGDVCNFSIGGQGPLITNPGDAILMAIATDLGIVTVLSAGNDCMNMDDILDWPETDPGSIVVGAGHPTFGFFPPYQRLGFTNHVTDELDRIHIQGWGTDIVTTGYGDLQGGGVNRRYTAGFGGTSSAAPMITATAASVQGICKMFFGVPLSPGLVRDTIVGRGQIPQEGEPNIQDVSGTIDDPPCNPCNVLCLDKDEDPQIIYGFPVPFDYFGTSDFDSLVENIFISNPFGDSFAVFFEVLLGNLMSGNLHSLKQVDGAVMIVASEFTEGGTGSSQQFPAPVYSWTGNGTDVAVAFDSIVPQNITQMTFSCFLATDSGGTGMYAVELYNFDLDRWVLQATAQIDGGTGFAGVTGNVAFHQQYINTNSRLALIRAWVFGMGFGGQDFNTAYDFINIDFTAAGFGGGGGV